MATGRPVALASPTAKKDPDRSSMWTNTLILGCRCSAIASGAEREPGETHAYSTPCCASSSTNVAAKDWATSIELRNARPRRPWRQPCLLDLRRGRACHVAAWIHAERPELARAGF